MDYLTMDENVCPVCGKQFYTVVGRDWGWSYKGSKYCTYHCMRHVEIRHRVQMGWEQRRLGEEWQTLSPRGKEVAAALRRLRALTKAYRALCGDRPNDDYGRSVYNLGARLRQMADEALSAFAPAFDRLDEGKRRLCYLLFADGEPVQKVCIELDMDADLLYTKLCHVYEQLAEVTV